MGMKNVYMRLAAKYGSLALVIVAGFGVLDIGGLIALIGLIVWLLGYSTATCFIVGLCLLLVGLVAFVGGILVGIYTTCKQLTEVTNGCGGEGLIARVDAAWDRASRPGGAFEQLDRQLDDLVKGADDELGTP